MTDDNDSRIKLGLLNREYDNFQAYIQGRKGAKLYSATKQQADRLAERIIRNGGKINSKKQYPLILRRDLIDIQKDSKFPSVYWMKVPVYLKSLHLKIHTDYRHELTEYDLREAKVNQQAGKWYIFLGIEKETKYPRPATNVLAIDLGVRHIAVTTNTANKRPNLYGQDLRRIRGFYFNLRRKLRQKKVFYKIKRQLKHTEFLQVNHELHKISEAMVEEA